MFCPRHIYHYRQNRTAAQYASSTERKRLISRFLLISSASRLAKHAQAYYAYTTRSGVMTRGLLSAIAAQTQMPSRGSTACFHPRRQRHRQQFTREKPPKLNALPCGKAFLCTKILQPFAKLRTTRQAATYSSMREPFSRSKSFCTKGQQP